MAFELSERLAKEGFDFGTHAGCRVLLKNNLLYPWFGFVPEVEDDVEERIDLSSEQCGDALRRNYTMQQNLSVLKVCTEQKYLRKDFGKAD